MTWNRLRYWPTRRRVLRIRGEYNPKTLRREKTIVDKRPIWWVLGLLVLALGPLFTPLGLQNTLLTAASTFAIYAAISLCWMLIIGTAGIYTLASYAVVGTAAFCTASLSIKFGVPWWLLPPIGAVVGLIFGGIIALPATRLDGFYYALLTLGLNELCRVYFTTSPVFGAANGGLFGADTFIPDAASQLVRLLTSYYACFALLLLALLFYRQVNGRRLGRILRMAPEKREAFAEATGVNFRQARVWVFVLSSIALGFIGGFYTANFGGVAFSIFNFDTVLLGLGMLVIGGIGRAEGAVVGTFIVVLLDKFLITLGPIRLILIGLIMLLAALYLRNGLFGIKAQFRNWRDKKKSERRSTRAEKGGEMLPEEATETHDKDRSTCVASTRCSAITSRRWFHRKSSRSTDESPQGQHSEALQRLAHLLPWAASSRQVCDYCRRAVQGISDRRVVRSSGGATACGRRQDLSDTKRSLPRRVHAARAGPARVLKRLRGRRPTAGRARFSGNDVNTGISRWHKSNSLVTRTRSR